MWFHCKEVNSAVEYRWYPTIVGDSFSFDNRMPPVFPATASTSSGNSSALGSFGGPGSVHAPQLRKKPRVEDSPKGRGIGSESPVKPMPQTMMSARRPNVILRNPLRSVGSRGAASARNSATKVGPVATRPILIKGQDEHSFGNALDGTCLQSARR